MKKCLIVDDANVIRKVAQVILSDMNYEVLEATDTDQALNICKTEQPEVIILDWHIPGCEPIDFLSTLRASFTGRRPYVLYCTTENDPDDISRAVNAGADDVLLKPFERGTLVNKFASLRRAA